jgi:hypothetical protein
MGVYKRLRQLLPKFEFISRENHFRKSKFLSSNHFEQAHSGMSCTKPSSFIGTICVGEERDIRPIIRRSLEIELGHLCLLPASFVLSVWLVMWEGRKVYKTFMIYCLDLFM